LLRCEMCGEPVEWSKASRSWSLTPSPARKDLDCAPLQKIFDLVDRHAHFVAFILVTSKGLIVTSYTNQTNNSKCAYTKKCPVGLFTLI